MIHHHIGGGGQAMPIPQRHHNGYGGIHNIEDDFGVRGNDYLTAIAQTFSNN